MKKITLLAVAFVAVSFASCKKDRTCVCTDNTGGTAYVATTVVKSTKKSAEEWCAASSGSKTTATYGGVAVPNSGPYPTCALK